MNTRPANTHPMNTDSLNTDPLNTQAMANHPPLNRRHLLALAASSLLTACGGGGGSAGAASGTSSSASSGTTAGSGTTGSTTGSTTAGVGTGGTGTGSTLSNYVMGAISGFGSIIVGGVRYDDSKARVSDDNGGVRRADELRLGMTVEIRASAPMVDAQGVTRATASQITFSRSLTGPISAIDPAASTLTVLGQTIIITPTTIFEDASGLSALVLGDVVEIYALTDPQGRRVATRIERKTPGSFDGVLVLTGTIASLNAARTEFKLGAVTVTLGSALAAGLGNGSEVRVLARATATANQVLAQSVMARQSVNPLEGVSGAEIEGFVTAFTSAASFSVNGTPVVTTATTKIEGATTAITLGARVEVEGTVTNGVLTATKVEIKSEEERAGSSSGGSSGSSGNSGGSGNSGSAPSADAAPFELHGGITAVDATAKTFVLRGLTIRWDVATEFRKMTAAQLAVGQQVEVKGVRGSDGVTLRALRVTLES